jgi:hypothetical protein
MKPIILILAVFCGICTATGQVKIPWTDISPKPLVLRDAVENPSINLDTRTLHEEGGLPMANWSDGNLTLLRASGGTGEGELRLGPVRMYGSVPIGGERELALFPQDDFQGLNYVSLFNTGISFYGYTSANMTSEAAFVLPDGSGLAWVNGAPTQLILNDPNSGAYINSTGALLESGNNEGERVAINAVEGTIQLDNGATLTVESDTSGIRWYSVNDSDELVTMKSDGGDGVTLDGHFSSIGITAQNFTLQDANSQTRVEMDLGYVGAKGIAMFDSVDIYLDSGASLYSQGVPWLEVDGGVREIIMDGGTIEMQGGNINDAQTIVLTDASGTYIDISGGAIFAYDSLGNDTFGVGADGQLYRAPIGMPFVERIENISLTATGFNSILLVPAGRNYVVTGGAIVCTAVTGASTTTMPVVRFQTSTGTALSAQQTIAPGFQAVGNVHHMLVSASETYSRAAAGTYVGLNVSTAGSSTSMTATIILQGYYY